MAKAKACVFYQNYKEKKIMAVVIPTRFASLGHL